MYKTILYIAFLLAGLFSCKNNTPVSNNQHLLWRNEFKGNSKVHTDELQALIPFAQRENSKPISLPITPRVWWYNFGKNAFDSTRFQRKISQKQNQIYELHQQNNKAVRKLARLNRKLERHQNSLDEKIGWFWSNIGEKQVYVSEDETKETSLKIQKYLFDLGYRDADVKVDIKPRKLNSERKNVTYYIDENELYTIDSVFYSISDSRIDSIVNNNPKLLKKGDALNKQVVELEKLRIEQLLKNNGYYSFSNRYIRYGVTNEEEDEEVFEKNKKGTLILQILNPEQSFHPIYKIKDIEFRTVEAPLESNSTIIDTTLVNGIKFIHQRNSIPLKTIRNRILNKPDEVYSSNYIRQTQRNISLFNQFSFASSQLKTLDSNQLALEYFAPLQERYTFGISPGINNIYTDGNSFFGFGVPVSLSMRNAFRKLETIELGIRASYEGQPMPIRTSENAIRGSLELGGNLNITLPNIIPAWIAREKINLKNPRTTLGIGYNYSEPFWGTRTNLKLTAGNSLQLSKNAIWYFNILDAYLINTSYGNNASGREFYNTLDSLQKIGNNLKVTFDPQFVSSINSNFVYNNQDPSKPFSDSKFLRLFIESAGTLMNFQKNRNQISFIENLFPMSSGPDSVRAYFQFVKFNADYRQSINLSSKSSYAYRVNLGVAHPYGKNKAIPYDKSFFVGGSNSIRAWAPRSLGTGSSVSDTTSVGNTIPQPGDILLEGSLEYRLNVLRFAGNIQLAAFIDAGNVWKWHQINLPEKWNKSNFDINRFYKEIAVGTGFGVRWDLGFFLFRFDWGIKVIDPSRPEGSRYVLNKFNLKGNNQYGLNLNFGIGYPF